MAVRVTAKVVKDIDKGLFEELRKRITGGHKTVNVGFPATGEQHEDSDMSVAAVATVHEFGTESIPERSFLRAGLRRNVQKYKRLNRASLQKILRGQTDFESGLALLGEMAKSDVQAEITNGDFAPLEPETIRRKGSSKPLIDKGQMRQSVAWEYGND